MKQLTAAFGILAILSAFRVSTVFAQEAPEPGTPVMVQMPDGTVRQAYAVGPATPKPEPKQFAFTFNPLNLYIDRYAFNFEYQPTLHHGLIVTPHFDHMNVDINGYDANNNSAVFKDGFTGYGAELGYRFYSGEKGFNGFFVSPQLLLATYKTSGEGLVSGAKDVSFTSYGWAVDLGGQAQIGSFIIGGGGGFQYTKVSRDFGDLPLAAAVIAGGGFRPRVLLNIGFAL